MARREDHRRELNGLHFGCVTGAALRHPKSDIRRGYLAAIKTDLEFVIKRIERLPTRKELARAALGITFCTAVVTTLFVWIACH